MRDANRGIAAVVPLLSDDFILTNLHLKGVKWIVFFSCERHANRGINKPPLIGKTLFFMRDAIRVYSY